MGSLLLQGRTGTSFQGNRAREGGLARRAVAAGARLGWVAFSLPLRPAGHLLPGLASFSFLLVLSFKADPKVTDEALRRREGPRL